MNLTRNIVDREKQKIKFPSNIFIDGIYKESTSGKSFNNISPIDGKLINTKILTNSPNIGSTHSLTLTPRGGFSGSITNFSYYTTSLNPREAYNKYKEGCGSTSWLGGLFNRYRLKLAFLKDEFSIMCPLCSNSIPLKSFPSKFLLLQSE